MAESWAEVLIELLAADKGGRQVPLDLCNDRPGQYRAHLRLVGRSKRIFAVVFMDGPDDPILPGGKTYATVKVLDEPGVAHEDLTEGMQFEVLEGKQVVGNGRVTRRKMTAQKTAALHYFVTL
jgi:hypothetical protein